jgi:pilus assembly protein CpaB
MKKVGIVLVVLILIVLIAGAVAYFVIGPEALQEMIGLTEEPTPTPEGMPTPTPTTDPGVDILVARFDLDERTVFTNTETFLMEQNMPTNAYEQLSDRRIRVDEFADKVYGKVLKIPILADEPLEESYLAPPGLSQQMPTAEPNRPRPKAYPLQVNKFSGVADQIQVGDSVDIVATFDVDRKIYTPPPPTVPPLPNEPPQPAQQGSTDTEILLSTKTIVQRAKVLNIVRPPPPTPPPAPAAEGEEGEAPPPTPVPTEETGIRERITEGDWILVLAISDQEAEIIEFSLQTGARLKLVLRGTGDEVFEDTLGATFDLVVSEFGVPLPELEEPFVFVPWEGSGPQPVRSIPTPEPAPAPAP